MGGTRAAPGVSPLSHQLCHQREQTLACSALYIWILNTSLGLEKQRQKVSFFQVAQSPVLSLPLPRGLGLTPASSHPSFPCFAGAVSMVITRHLTEGVFECPRIGARLPSQPPRVAQLLASCLKNNLGAFREEPVPAELQMHPVSYAFIGLCRGQ